MILLENENKSLQQKCNLNNSTLHHHQQSLLNRRSHSYTSSSSSNSSSNHYQHHNHQTTDEVEDDDDGYDDSDVELEKCLYGVRNSNNINNHQQKSETNKIIETNDDHDHDKNRNNIKKQQLQTISWSPSSASSGNNNHENKLVNYSLPTSTKLCDNINKYHHHHQLKSSSSRRIVPCDDDVHVNCHILIDDLSQKCSQFEVTFVDLNEKNYVLEKLNRSIEIENENFAYKVSF